jgi:O-antigen ligase/polysaccharide polymerase Wzy-like membrane protein
VALGVSETSKNRESRESGARRGRRRSRRKQWSWSVAKQLAPWVSRQRLENAVVVLLVLVLLGSVMAIGAVHPLTITIIAALAGLTLAASLSLEPRRLKELPRMALLLWGLAAFTLLQIVPLPFRLLEVIAPANADVWGRALMPLGESAPRFAPISLDPSATWVEVLRWFSYGAVVVGAATVSRKRGLRWAAGLVCLTALVAALATVGHGLAGAERVFGVYAPSFRPQPWHVSPLLNPNNLAGLLNLGALCGLGLLVDDEPPVARWVLALGVAIIVAVDIASASRSGVIMLIVGVIAFAVMTEAARRRHLASSLVVQRTRFLMAAAVVFGVVLAILASTSLVWEELFNEDLRKLELIPYVFAAVPDFPFFGIGRGAFESVFTSYQPAGTGVTFTHAENFVGQWLLEWGVPVGGLAMLSFGWLLRARRFDISRSRVAAGAWIGIVALLIQNLADLGLEIPALCLAVAVLLGALEEHGAEESVHGTSRGAAVAALATLTLVVLGGVLGRHDMASERQAVRAALLSDKVPREPARREELRGRLRAAMARHPAEPYFPLAGALLAWQERDQSPLPWLQRTLERSRTNGRAHLLVAMVLETVGARKQALLELRLAMESDPSMHNSAAQLAVRWARDMDELAETVPAGTSAAAIWDLFGATAPNRKLGATCDERALELEADRTGPHIRLAQDLIVSRQSGDCASEKNQAKCAASVEEHASVVERELPETSSALQLRARWIAATGDNKKAAEMLKERCAETSDQLPCLELRLHIASQVQDAAIFSDAADALRRASCLNVERCARVNTWIGDAHHARREYGAAVAAYERALRDEPTDERFLKLAEAASGAGLEVQALKALERMNQQHGQTDPAIKKRIEELRRKLAETTAPP